ncbi:zinc ribbon domain-containing protein [Bifidobacterium primatium]|uniref:zinc ribbon domain-containing protein n=1 Tax=Bifidobacterium primatium TaxID=2045438 RepID=UPI001056400D|nr:zinc ribbon domain-containing protein [Bifidobacterium primatium]
MKFCTNCGVSITGESKFCDYCYPIRRRLKMPNVFCALRNTTKSLASLGKQVFWVGKETKCLWWMFFIIVLVLLCSFAESFYKSFISGETPIVTGSQWIFPVLLIVEIIVASLLAAALVPFFQDTSKIREAVEKALKDKNHHGFKEGDEKSITNIWHTERCRWGKGITFFGAIFMGLMLSNILLGMLWPSNSQNADIEHQKTISSGIIVIIGAFLFFLYTQANIRAARRLCFHLGMSLFLLVIGVIVLFPDSSKVGNAATYLLSFAILAVLWISIFLIFSDLDTFPWVEKQLDYWCMLWWRRTLVKNHFPNEHIQEIGDTSGFEKANQWSEDIKLFLIKKVADYQDYKIPSIIAGVGTLAATWSTAKDFTGMDDSGFVKDSLTKMVLEQVDKSGLNLNTRKVIEDAVDKVEQQLNNQATRFWEALGLVIIVIVCTVVVQTARSYYWRRLSAAARVCIQPLNSNDEKPKEGKVMNIVGPSSVVISVDMDVHPLKSGERNLS